MPLEQPSRKRGRWRLILFGLLAIALIGSPALTSPKKTEASTAPTTSAGVATQLASLQDYLAVKPGAKDPYIPAKEFILLDAANGQVLTENNSHTPAPIASTTKMMTALVASQLFKPTELVTISKFAAAIEGSKANLVAGKQYTVKDLYSALLIPSGNDAAYALAEHYSGKMGDYQPFVDQMNKFAANHHLANTHYGDPAGLDDENGHSTAYDLAQIGRLLIQNPILAKVVATGQTTISSADGSVNQSLKNSNHLVVTDDPLYLPNVTGIKTGFTPAAGHCLVSSYSLNGHLLVGVVMNTDAYTITASAEAMRRLFSWADNNVTIQHY